jgi:hypothetical protein
VFPKENLLWVSFNEKIPVSIETDEVGREVFKDGQPVWREEYVEIWSIKMLKDLFYENKIEMPLDHKLDSQLNSVIATQSGNRTLFHCLAKEDHLLSAFKVFAIDYWNNEWKLLKPIRKKAHGKIGA